MSEWCDTHKKDYNLLCGCPGCKDDGEKRKNDAEPILPKEVFEAQKAVNEENAHLRLQIRGLQDTIQATRKDRDHVTTILQAIKKRGYLARGEADEIDAYFAREATTPAGIARDVAYGYLSLSYSVQRKLAEEFGALDCYDEKDEVKRHGAILRYVKDTGRLEEFATRVGRLKVEQRA